MSVPTRSKTPKTSRLTGTRSETFKHGASYFGRVAVYDDGRRMYAVDCEVARISRGDAMSDAQRASVELILVNNGRPRARSGSKDYDNYISAEDAAKAQAQLDPVGTSNIETCYGGLFATVADNEIGRVCGKCASAMTTLDALRFICPTCEPQALQLSIQKAQQGDQQQPLF